MTTPIKVLSAAFAVTMALLPQALMAQGCPHDRTTIKMTCAEGSAWDESTRKCEPIVGA